METTEEWLPSYGKHNKDICPVKTAILDTEPLARAILQPRATTVKVAARLDSLALRPLRVKARYA